MTRGGARVVLASALLVLASVGVLVRPSGVAAADVTFGKPTADVAYGESIDFTVDVQSAAPLARVELRLGFPGALGPLIVDVPVIGGASTRTLHYQLDLTGGGHLVPNTPITATWAAFTAPGGDPVLSAPQTVRYADTTKEWQSLKGDLVTVHWYQGDKAFAEKALRIGDQAVKDTAQLLGVTETEPIDFYIYGDQASFRDALGPGTRENVGGQAHSDIRTLFALIEPQAINDPWVGIVIPHELVHLVFDTAVSNPYRFPPRWLNEGLAVYLSEGYGGSDRGLVRDAVSNRDLIPLVALGGQFPTDAAKTSLAYAESVSAIDYLVRTNDQQALLDLVAAYKDGLTDDEAFTKALGEDLAAFQAGWLAELGADAPEQYGPQPAPPGPLPSGWSGPAPTSAPGVTPGAATPGAGPSAAPGPGTSASGSGDGGPSLAVIAAGLALVVVLVMGGLILARRREPAA
jgi:hypothetical protein